MKKFGDLVKKLGAIFFVVVALKEPQQMVNLNFAKND